MFKLPFIRINLVTIIVILAVFVKCRGEKEFKLLDIVDFSFIRTPPACSETFAGGLILVHSAPRNVQKRELIRKTWGGVKNYQTAFLLGTVEDQDLQRNLEEEDSEHGDLVQGSFVDSYRNLTYKHLMGYRYAVDYCPSASFLLKTDDDVAVDTFHLPRYLRNYIKEFDRKEPFYLCDVVDTRGVIRDPDGDYGKWAVTREEFPGDAYPLFCSGWAYATNAAAAEAVLAQTSRFPKWLWIDDVFVTGLLRPAAGVAVYNWRKATLRNHVQYTNEVFHSPFFTPELMGASNLTPAQIETLFRKFQESEEKGWAQRGIYSDKVQLELFRPDRIEENNENGKEEL